MCGIFGFISEKPLTTSTIFTGLKSLEYRGYDSWGIAAKSPTSKSKILIEKEVGKLDSSKLPANFLSHNSHLAIGHTRWATHGGATRLNAHPHLDCTKKFALVHNGIVENHHELKLQLEKKGHTFISETDTETIIHLIEEYAKQNSFYNATKKAFKKLQGLNAIIVMSASSDEIIAIKNGSPLLIGKGDSKFFFASDTTGVIPHTRSVLFLKDNEVAHIQKDTLLLSTLDSEKRIAPKFEQVEWTPEEISRGSFSHFMIKEIHEQPHVIQNMLSNTSHINHLAKVIKKADTIFFIAAGTAYNATLTGVHLLANVSHIHAHTSVASEFNYLLQFINRKGLIIALSQSGETIDVIEPLSLAQKKGAKTLGVINTLGSTIYRMADYKFLLEAGPERAVASTKAYTAKLTLLLLLTYTLIDKQNEIRPFIEKTIHDIKQLLKKNSVKKIETLSNKIKKSKSIYVIGRGISYPTSLEAALKIKEVSNIPTEGLPGGELKHGTLSLIEKGTPCIVFAPNDDTYDAIISNATEIKARGGFIIGISFKNSKIFDEWIYVPDRGDATILSQIIPAQLLAYFLAIDLKKDPDMPRNLAKSVTVK